MDINLILNKIHLLPHDSSEVLKSFITEVSLPKGHILLDTKNVEKNIFFIKKGIVRAFSRTPNNDITFWIGSEGETVISMKSYVANKIGYETIELLENGDFYQLNTNDLHKLYEKDIHIANWGRKFAEKELLKTEERLISRQFKTASERYIELLTENPNLIQRVQLGHIASYLGITQVSLSRIRADIK